MPEPSRWKNANCCELLKHAIPDKRSPLVYDERAEEIQLRLADDSGFAVVRYCPFCGQQLESGRGQMWTEPLSDELDEVHRLLDRLSTIDQVVEALGKPTDKGTGGGPQSNPWKSWYRFSDRWKSLVLVVGKHDDGRISSTIHGQFIGRPSTDEACDSE